MRRRALLRHALWGWPALNVAGLPVAFAGPAATASPGGRHRPDFVRPFAADSPWNLRPVAPRLGAYVLPATRYHPFVGPGAYSTGVFRTSPGDPPVIVSGASEGVGVWCVDEGEHRNVTIPRWPDAVRAATGDDGHADLIDETSGIVHSFWQLRRSAGRWTATQYAWSSLTGRGWPDPAHFHQGARAAGVPTCGGLIRRVEVDDGLPHYAHVLAMSLAGNALKRGYVYPAGNEDGHAATSYSGQVPMGSLLMLPADFDPARLNTPALRKVARTLMTFGARVVDQNLDTRFALYVENGASFDLHAGGWNLGAANDLLRIADGLRPLVSAAGWIGADDRPAELITPLNLLSLRGPWRAESGAGGARFDSWRQALILEAPGGAAGEPSVHVQAGGEGARRMDWAPWRAGSTCTLQVSASGGACLRLQLRAEHTAGRILWDSGDLTDGQSAILTMPAGPIRPFMRATSGVKGASSISATLMEHSAPRLSAR